MRSIRRILHDLLFHDTGGDPYNGCIKVILYHPCKTAPPSLLTFFTIGSPWTIIPVSDHQDDYISGILTTLDIQHQLRRYLDPTKMLKIPNLRRYSMSREHNNSFPTLLISFWLFTYGKLRGAGLDEQRKVAPTSNMKQNYKVGPVTSYK